MPADPATNPLRPEIADLARGANYGTLSFHFANGTIGSHVMWVDATDEYVLINTEIHRAKYRAIAADPRVTVTIWEAANPYRYAEIRGTVVGEIRGAEARAHIDALSNTYMGRDYANQIVSERVIVQIAPVQQRAKGF